MGPSDIELRAGRNNRNNHQPTIVEMTYEQRLKELGRILAIGYLRMVEDSENQEKKAKRLTKGKEIS